MARYYGVPLRNSPAIGLRGVTSLKGGGGVGYAGPTSVEYLVVAGGGGSYGAYLGSNPVEPCYNGAVNSPAGGGAGGYRTATGYAVTGGTAYTVIVGAGGNTSGSNGSDSVFDTITSAGGGGVKNQPYYLAPTSPGGSGAGAHFDSQGCMSGGLGNTPPTTPSQGNNGGNAVCPNPSPYNWWLGTGGGGGANAAGGSATWDGSVAYAGSGGAGKTSSISGASVTYAGGGGGGGSTLNTAGADPWPAGAGGAGGGGAGGTGAYSYGANGTANTGGGAGGDGWVRSGCDTPTAYSSPGKSGGSGVVIIRYPDTFPLAKTTTGSPTVTTTGGYRIYRWTGSGSITF
jgi:hypothetical protein